MMQRLRDSDLAGNMLWLVVSVILATGVWYIAVTSSDPIGSRRFQSVPIQFVPSNSTVLTKNPTRFVTVTIQGSQSMVTSRRPEDVVVRADLTRLGAGTHTVPLDVRVAVPESDSIRRLVAQTQPSQITVELEQIVGFEKPLSIFVIEPPPIGFRNDEPESDVLQVLVSGASTIVPEVVDIRADLDLSAFRSPILMDVRLYAVDAEGDRVNDVQMEPQTVSVSVNITRRDDVRQIAVRPNILVGTLPEGYTFKTFSSDPPSLFVGGAPEQLSAIADTLFTAPISLEDRRSEFEITVPVELPDDELIVMGGDNSIIVSIEILPITTSRQIADIDVGAIGLGEGFIVAIVPQSVTAIVNGPVALVDTLTSEDIQVVLDLNGLAAGVYDLEPSIGINQSELSESDISLLPAELNVEIVSPESTAVPQLEEDQTREPAADS